MWKRKMFCFTSVASNSLRGSALDARGMTTPCVYLRYTHTLDTTNTNTSDLTLCLQQNELNWFTFPILYNLYNLVYSIKWVFLVEVTSVSSVLEYRQPPRLHSFHGFQSLLLGNRVTDTTYLSPRYNLCPVRGRTFPATSRLLWPSYKLVCTVCDKPHGASLLLSFQTGFSLFVLSLLWFVLTGLNRETRATRIGYAKRTVAANMSVSSDNSTDRIMCLIG